MRFRIALVSAFLLVSAALGFAAETPIPPSPTQWVTDTANFMSPQAAQSLDAQLSSYSQQTGHQLLVYIGQTTGDDPIDDWAVRAFAKWKVGRKGIDDGVVLFIMAQDHKLRFEVGYGLEGDIPDVIASRIINEIMVPQIRAGKPDAAVTSGMAAIVQTIGGQALPAQQNRPDRQVQQNQPLTLGQIIFFGIIAVIVLFILVTHPSLALFLLANLLSGGDRRGGGGWGGGGGGGGGGGFGGGGGMSGGGGASGSW